MSTWLYPDPRHLTDDEIEERLVRIWDGVDNVPISFGGALAREQDRRAAMTAHERIALRRALAPRAAGLEENLASLPDSRVAGTHIPSETSGVEP